jgi:hypothetical protein
MTTIDNSWGSSSSSITADWFADGNDADPVVVTAWIGNTRKSSSPHLSLNNGNGIVSSLQQGQTYDIYLTDINTNKISNKSSATTLGTSHHSIFKQRFPIKQKNTGYSDLHPANAAVSHSLIDQRLFDLLVPEEGNFIGHYVRKGTSGGWTRVDRLMLPDGEQIPDTAVSHIQSFRAPEHLNALALLQPGGFLIAFEYGPDTGDQKPIPVIAGNEPITQVNGTPALVQTDQGLFHLLVSLPDPDQPMNQIVHLVQSDETIQNPWKRVATLPVPGGSSVVSIALVQADSQGSLKAVVRVRPSEGSDILVSYQSDPDFHWQGPFGLPVVNSEEILVPQHGDTIRNVAGAPGLVQSIFGDQEQIDLLVPIANVETGDITLIQFTQPAGIQTSIDHPWMLAAMLQPLNDDPRTQVVSASITQDSNRNLQSIAHVTTPKGQNLLAFYIFDPQTGWSQPSLVTTSDGKPIVVGQNKR